MAKRFEILEEERLLTVVRGNLESIASRYRGFGKYPAEKNQLSMREQDLSYCYEIATYQHLEIELGSVDVDRFIREGAKIAVDYFYGEFLKTDESAARMMSKAEDNLSLQWFDVHREGLLLAFLAQDQESERKLVEWIEPGLPFDESSHLVKPEDNDYHKILAEFVKNGEVLSQQLENKIKSSRRRRPKLLLACLDAIRTRDAAEFSSCLKKFLNYFLQSEFRTSGFTTYFSIEASLLRHLADKAGFELTGLTEKQFAVIMTRESLSLAA